MAIYARKILHRSAFAGIRGRNHEHALDDFVKMQPDYFW